jgi:hypothetical protein
MEETSTKVIFIINRDTGEFRLFNYYFILDFRTYTVYLKGNDNLIPVCTGNHHKNNWYFTGMSIVRVHTDPFVAIFKVLFYIFKY